MSPTLSRPMGDQLSPYSMVMVIKWSDGDDAFVITEPG